MNTFLILAMIPWAVLLWPVHHYYYWLFLRQPHKEGYGNKMAVIIQNIQIALLVVQILFLFIGSAILING